jgi:hypothetical protein
MSVIAEAKKNWLEQVKQDSEALTRERLAIALPKLNEVAERMVAQSVPEKPAKKGNEK